MIRSHMNRLKPSRMLAVCLLSLAALPLSADAQTLQKPLPQSRPKPLWGQSMNPDIANPTSLRWEGNAFFVTGPFAFDGVRGLGNPAYSFKVESKDGDIIVRAESLDPASGPLLNVPKDRVNAKFYPAGASQPVKPLITKRVDSTLIMPPARSTRGGRYIITVSPPAAGK